MTTYSVGAMSGTSCDGVDIVITRYQPDRPAEVGEIVASQVCAMDGALQQRLQGIIGAPSATFEDITACDAMLGEVVGESVARLLREHSIAPHDVAAIGWCGHTLWYDPGVTDRARCVSVGDPARIAGLVGCPVVGHIRQTDIAAGGRGAPLAGAFHVKLGWVEASSATMNIGGIGNVTAHLAGAQPQAWDSGPGTCLLDEVARTACQIIVDEGGQRALTGTAHARLLRVLLQDPYIAAEPPKTTGREYFTSEWLAAKCREAQARKIAPHDLLATLAQFTAQAALVHLPSAVTRLVVCGGGRHNRAIMNAFEASGVTAVSSDCLGVNGDHVEALMCGWFAQLRMGGVSAPLMAYTGANHDVPPGAVYRPGPARS